MPNVHPLHGRSDAESPFSSIEEAIENIRQGRIVILVDDEDRENEGDFVMAAEKVTPETINFMVKEGRGLVCLSLTPERVEKLGLPMMVDSRQNASPFGTPFTVSIEAREGVTTGISAYDRAHTIQTAIREDAQPGDLVMPGHVFPLRARPGGVLRRAGHTEGAADLARLAGLEPAGVVCEILKDDGTMARLPDLVAFARKHNLALVTIKDLIAYRMRHDRFIERVEEADLPTDYGVFRAMAYRNRNTGRLHLALVMGEIDGDVLTLVRVQPARSISDIVNLLRVDATDRIHYALARIQKEGRGVLVYLQADMMEEKSVSLTPDAERQRAPSGTGRTSSAGLREYGIGAQILADLGLRRIRIMTNEERRIVALEGYGLELEERVPVDLEPELPALRLLGTSRGTSYLQRH